jgi:WD40 repeat protein
MTFTLLRPAMLIAGLAVVLPLRGQDDPKIAEPRKEAPLPEGARLRLGIGSPFPFAWWFALQPPDFRTMLAFDAQGGLEHFDVATGRGRSEAAALTLWPVILSNSGNRYLYPRGGRLSISDTATGSVVAVFQPERGFSSAMASDAANASLSADGGRVAQGGQSNNRMGHVEVHDVASKSLIFQAPMQYSGAVIPVLSGDGRRLATRPHRVEVGANSKEDPKLVAAAQVWDVDEGKELFRARVTGGGLIEEMAFSPDGKTLAVSCGQGPIDLWEVPEGKHRASMLGRTRQGMRLAFSPDGRTLASLSGEGVVQRWNAADGKLIDSTEWPTELWLSHPIGVAFAPEGSVVAWGRSFIVPVVWEAPSGKVLSRLPEHSGEIRGIGFAAGGKEIVTAGHDGRINRWDTTTGRLLRSSVLRVNHDRLHGPQRVIACLAPDGSRAMTASFRKAIYELPSAKEMFAIPAGPALAQTQGIFPTPDLAMSITVSIQTDRKTPGTATVWDLKRGRQVGEVELEPGMDEVPAAALTPDGKRLILATSIRPDMGPWERAVAAWDIKTGKRVCQVGVDPLTWPVRQLTAADESTLLVYCGGGKHRRLDIDRGQFGDDLEPTEDWYTPPSPIVFSPDRKQFAVGVSSGGPERRGLEGVRIHEWPSGKVLHTFHGHWSQITALTFSPDGKLVASGSYDGTTFVWDLAAIGK